METSITDQVGNVQIQEFNAEIFLETNVAGLNMKNQDTASSEYVVSETQVLQPELTEPAHRATSADATLHQEIERVINEENFIPVVTKYKQKQKKNFRNLMQSLNPTEEDLTSVSNEGFILEYQGNWEPGLTTGTLSNLSFSKSRLRLYF